ncbi:hypothetical protein [Kutzneria buriramensis]|uniref:Uncharacterized protein n=1 Tax=Kutzneria buriramensis TaxID=1045776 RepID=A0A3E0HMR0_9PSEU|nr:hypothetical protein [Kutzneria buriramensis]REH47295.1 hypothetical protein BCF44_106460 [Kutzneria buriramensis]
METIIGPGTIDDLVADARRTGYQGPVNRRLIRDWTQAGLLDYPRRRTAGKGHGARPALYPAHQRLLLLTLLRHRPTNGIRSLARIPVGIWMYWGDAFIPLRQVRRAMTTWLGDPRDSRRGATETARELVRLLDNPAATTTARATLRRVLSDIAYTGQADFEQLEQAVREVFEPGARQIQRAVGHPAAPLTAHGLVTVIQARLVAVDRLAKGEVTDAEFLRARHNHLVAYAQYAADQAQLAADAPTNNPDMYEAVTAERALNDCCANLLSHLGLATLSPEGAARISREPSPTVDPGPTPAGGSSTPSAPRRSPEYCGPAWPTRRPETYPPL